MKSSLLPCLYLFLVITLPAQDFPRKEFDPEQLAEDIFLLQNPDLDHETLYENLIQRLANPIDLNQATAEEFRSLLVLRQGQIESLLAYRQENGPFLSVYELQAVPGLDLSTLSRLMPFVKVVDTSTRLDKSIAYRILNESNSYFIARCERTLEEKQGYRHETDSSRRYAGSPDKLYVRFRTSRTADFSFGFTAEKDAGESIVWNLGKNCYGMDYYSIHGQVINKGIVRNLIIGDYQAQFGQGLVLGGGFGMGKGAEAVTALRRSTIGFIPYTSVNESGFFRGAAASVSLRKDLALHAFGSSLKRDALLNPESIAEESSLISSFAISGYHRTPGERASRKRISETNFGTVLHYHHLALDAGLIFAHTGFSLPVIHTPAIYNRFYFSGNQNSNLGGFLNFSKNNFAFFCELAQTLHHGRAVVAGMLASLTPRLDVSLLYRNFGRTFYTFYGNAVSENTTPQNESGCYWGFNYVYSKQYALAGYLDVFRFPWLRYRGYAPSDGNEWLLRFTYQPTKKSTLFIQAREELKIRNVSGPSNLYKTDLGRRRNVWINCDYTPLLKWSFKTRVQWSSYRLEGQVSRGIALIQDVTFGAGRFSISCRYALFDTDSYDDRLYVYERDVALALSFPAYDGTGIRRYALVQYTIGKHIDVWLRWASTRYTDRSTIGTSGEAIAGNLKNDVKLQLRIKL